MVVDWYKLGPLEVAAFSALLACESATVQDLAKAVGAQRSLGYRLASALVDAGLAREILERPVRLRAEPLDTLLHRMERASAQAAAEVRDVRSDLTGRHRPVSTPAVELHLLTGRARGYEAIARMADDATARIEIMDTHPQALTNLAAAGLEDVLQDRMRDGVQVRSLLATPMAPPWESRVLHDHPTEVRWVMRDRAEAVIFIDTREHRTFRKAGDKAIWTNASHLVTMLGWLFDEAWPQAGSPGASTKVTASARLHEEAAACSIESF